jgi:hypothetical protein
MNLDTGADREIDEDRVPAELVAMIPLVKKWGYERNADQDRLVAEMMRERPSEVSSFKVKCDEYHKVYHNWLCSIPRKHMDDMTSSDWSHPSFAFTSMYRVRDLLPLEEHEITDEMRADQQRMKEERQQSKYLQAASEADVAFRQRKYALYVELLEPYQDIMAGSVVKKFVLAKKKHDAPD